MNGAHARTNAVRRTVLAASLVIVTLLALVPVVASSHSTGSLHAVAAGPHPSATGICAVGSGPGFPGYDPVRHYVYVPNQASGNISVLSGTCTHVGTITLPLGASPISAAFNPSTNTMYVTDDGLNQVYVILGLTVLHTLTSSLITAPREIIYDPGDAMMLLTNDFSTYSVVGIQGSSVVGMVGVGSYPQGLCYDPFYGTVLVVNYLSSNVSILNALTPLNGVIATVAVGFDPKACVYDPANQRDYVTNYGDNNVSVLLGNGFSVGNVSVGSLPSGIGWDQATLQVWVANTGHGALSLIQGFSVVKTIFPGVPSPQGMAFDEYNNRMYVASYGGNSVYVEP
jgi:DNA-binding beta-propeller fold protein YncE